MIDFENKFSAESTQVLHIAKSYAKDQKNSTYNAAHLLKALVHQDAGLQTLFDKLHADIYYIEEWAEVRIEALPKVFSLPTNMDADQSIEAVLHEADSIQLKINSGLISPQALLLSVCTAGVGFSFEQLKSLPLKTEDILAAIPNSVGLNSEAVPKQEQSNRAKKTNASLQKYCTDKTLETEQNLLPYIFGRDSEIKTIIEVLGRHLKPNVLILGESGVGKTAVLDGFVNAVCNSAVTDILKNPQIYRLDILAMVSGTSYKSEIDDRFQKICLALKNFEKPILLIDDINTLIDKESGHSGIINILKAELTKGEITVIATATYDAFRKSIENDDGLVRLFDRLDIVEPTEAECLKMLSNTIGAYKSHHQLEIEEQDIAEAIRLSKRYLKDRCLPDSAIDLIDRTMAAARYMIETTADKVDLLKTEVQKLITATDTHESEKLNELKWYWDTLKNRFSYLLFTELDDQYVFDEKLPLEEQFQKIEALLYHFIKKSQESKNRVHASDLAATIANKTGIPVGDLQADEKERLLDLETELQKRVVGQDHAIATLAAAVLESRSGLNKPGLPIGSFFFTGPTGTGKTELAKSLAAFLFQTESAIIRFDMSEFKEEHAVALLYGAPPGYIGYEEGGVLVNKIRQKPYAIVLFDEIEKAHPAVFDIFLQILDEGKLSDRLGKQGDFSNAVILFTSNIGSEQVVRAFEQGSLPKNEDLLEYMAQYFRPEFLGRLTEIVPFAPIDKENAVKIFDIQMKDLYLALQKLEIKLEIEGEAKYFLANQGFNAKYGARPIRAAIRKYLRTPLSKMLIDGKIKKGCTVQLHLVDDRLEWKTQNQD